MQGAQLGPPARCPFTNSFFGEGSPTKIENRKQIGHPSSNLSTGGPKAGGTPQKNGAQRNSSVSVQTGGSWPRPLGVKRKAANGFWAECEVECRFPRRGRGGSPNKPLKSFFGLAPPLCGPFERRRFPRLPKLSTHPLHDGPFRDAHLAEVGDFELILDESVFGSALLNLA